MFLKKKKTAGRTLAQGTGDIHSRWFWSYSHNQQCITFECQILDLPFDAGKQPIFRMIDNLNVTNRILIQFFAHSNVTQINKGKVIPLQARCGPEGG